MATTAKTTKTKPAKKPATKPAGASVKPKQTKTIKTSSAKPAKKPAAAKSTSTTQTSKNTKGKTNNRKCEVFFGIIMIIAAVAIVGGAICYALFGGKDDNTIMVETGKGNQVSTVLTQLPNTNISLLIPKDFEPLTDAELKELDSVIDTSDADIKAVYANKDQTAMIYLTELDQPTDNSKIKESIDEIAKVLKTAGVTNVQTSLKDVQGHNIGILKFSGVSSTDFPHQHTAFFSDGNKTYNVAFLCEQSLVDEWDKVGDTIINSITFQE